MHDAVVSSGVFKGGIGRCPPPFEPTLFFKQFFTVHLHNYKLEVCRQSLGPFYVNDFADVTPLPMLAEVLCSKPGTLHSSLGVRRPAEQGMWAGIMLHCSVDCIVKSAQSRHRRRPGHVFRRSALRLLAHPQAMTVLQIRLPI